MVPKKAKELVKVTAEKTELPEELVNDFVSFYWAEIRQKLSDVTWHNLNVDNLGVFMIKTWKIDELKEKYYDDFMTYKKIIQKKELSFQQFAIMKDAEKKLDKFKRAQLLIKNDQEKKKQIKELRNAGKTKNNLEESQGDSTGI